MIRFAVFCLCVSLILARKLPGARIINGESASPGQFPYQAASWINGEDEGPWFCGGSIINEEWILTAGHCVEGGVSGRVITGSLDSYSNQSINITELVLHEGYNAKLANDVGLVKLAQPLELGENVAIISLDSEVISEGQAVTVSGWGATTDENANNGIISQTLNYLNLVTISNEECKKYYPGLLEGNICTVSDNDEFKNPCSGDSGGPLVIFEEGQAVQVGVASFVPTTAPCNSSEPSGFSRVSYYLDWIQSHIG